MIFEVEITMKIVNVKLTPSRPFQLIQEYFTILSNYRILCVPLQTGKELQLINQGELDEVHFPFFFILTNSPITI
jgi:hypothetical protein